MRWAPREVIFPPKNGQAQPAEDESDTTRYKATSQYRSDEQSCRCETPPPRTSQARLVDAVCNPSLPRQMMGAGISTTQDR